MSVIHPCFSREAGRRHGRMHLPVAPACNIRCNYCDRRFSCVNESRPGVAAHVLKPAEALVLAFRAREKMPWLSVAGIAGPGDPLANPESTLETFRLVRQEMPDILLCLSTNGLALPDYADDLGNLGVSHLTVTINAVDPAIGAKIYRQVQGSAGQLEGRRAAEYLLERQLLGLAKIASQKNIVVKVNMVIVPGINLEHAPEAARKLSGLGVSLMNCIPLAPVKGTPFEDLPEPTKAEMSAIRREAGKWLPQMTHCGRCRADAVGFLGERRILGEMG